MNNKIIYDEDGNWVGVNYSDEIEKDLKNLHGIDIKEEAQEFAKEYMNSNKEQGE